MSKSAEYPPEDKIALYDKLIATNPNIVRKGKTSPLYICQWAHVHLPF